MKAFFLLNGGAQWVAPGALFRGDDAARCIDHKVLILSAQQRLQFCVCVAGLSSPGDAIGAGDDGAVAANHQKLID